MEKKERQKRVLQGVVVSDKMDKTIVVMTERRMLHPQYKKYVTRKKKYMAHDEENQCGIGDKVEIIEHRPLSHSKHWRLKKIVEKAKLVG